jgi:cytoskeletal protein RodZ
MDLGSHLRAAREQRKLTLDVLAARTKIARHLLVDLEANDFSRWPRHQVYRHGFLRAYADAVGLDAEPLIAKFVKEFSEDQVRETVEPPTLTVKSPTRSSWWLTAVIAVAAIGLSVAAILLVDAPTSRDDRSGVQAVTPQGAAPVTDKAPAEPESSKPTSGVTTLPTPPTGSTPIAAEAAPGTPEVAQNPVFVEGELVIESEPSGAAVVVNGIGRGRSPLRVQYLPLGAHTIRLVLAGYESQEQSVTLTSTRPARSLTIVLQAAVPR